MLTLLIVIAGGSFAFLVHSLIPQTPGIEALLDAQIAEPSLLLSADGTRLAEFSQGQQERVELPEISPYVIKALIATEDQRFFQHRGIDLRRTLSAVYQTLRGNPQGGSTITQQLVRNIFPDQIGRSRTLERKLKEMITAVKIEQAYTKEEILETYLNTVPFLYNVVGIEMAARTYYNKTASELNARESATLIGMLKGTSYYNPVLNPARALQRRNVVLAQMLRRNELTEEEFQVMRNEPLQVQLNRPPDPLSGPAPHFAGQVRRMMIDWADQNDYNLFTDGLVIHSTIDDRLQQAAAAAVARQTELLQAIAEVEWGEKSARVWSHSAKAYVARRKRVEPFRYLWRERPDLLDQFIRETPEYRRALAEGQSDAKVLSRLKADSGFISKLRDIKTRLEAGFVAIDPGSGEVRAWVGSRDFGRDQFDHVAQAVRQPGSTFKPVVYGAALELGIPPGQIYLDGPVEIRSADGSIWRPTDMSGASGRWMSMREGLIHSKNTITVQLMQDVGLSNIVSLAQALGIQSKLDPVPSLSLGTSPVTLLEMVSAYGAIANAGEYRKPMLVTRITDRNGKVLAEFQPEGQRALSGETALELIDMLRAVVRQGTGTAVRNQFNITADVAGKTGTTQNNTDGWFILMHPQLVAGAWVGFNDQRVAMRSDYWGQGGHNAVLLVGDFFKGSLKSRLIDAKAQFPQSSRQDPALWGAGSGDWYDQLNLNGSSHSYAYGVITPGAPEAAVISPELPVQVEPSEDARSADAGRLAADTGRESSGASSQDSNTAFGAAEDDGEAGRSYSRPYINLW